jgi:arylsulfatase K
MPNANILFIECDSMDGRIMSCMDHPAVHTPNMDALAQRGVLFRNAYCNSPQCCPSRASRWSGKHNHVIEAWNNYKGIEEGDRTYVSDLEAAGYHHQAYGKTDYVSGNHSLGNRVTSWNRATNITLSRGKGPIAGLRQIDEPERRVHTRDWEHVDNSIAYLKDRAADGSSFILHCSISCPHPAFVSSKYYLDRIDYDKVTVPPFEKDLHPVMAYMSDTKACLDRFTDEEIRRVRHTYFAMVAEVDEMVGELVGAYDELGLVNNTYILFGSDHGEMNMEHRQQLKNAMYEASARVPLIIAGPDVVSDHKVDELVSLVDLYPTFMDMTGLAKPGDLAGTSLMPELQGGNAADRPDSVLCQYHGNFANTGEFMIRRGQYKYVAYAGYDPQLFDLANDPDEIDNLVEKNPELASDMDQALREQIDYEAVDAKVKRYDRESYKSWRAEIGEDAYEEEMSQILPGWSDKERRITEDWLTQSA